jgi:hypothetical protein
VSKRKPRTEAQEKAYANYVATLREGVRRRALERLKFARVASAIEWYDLPGAPIKGYYGAKDGTIRKHTPRQ